jgi:hypothetical protein
MLTEFAKHSIAIDDDECVRLRVRAREAVLRAIASQEPVQAASDPVPRFLELLRAAILSGRAHLTDASGQPPKSIEKEFAGWQMVHSKDGEIDPAWQCRGTRVGWVLSDGLFLIPSAAFQAAQSMADDGGRLVLSAKTLGKRLSERGMLLSEDRERRRHTIKKQIGKARPDVLHLDAALILESPQSPPSPHRDQRPEDDAQTVAEEPGDSEPDAPLAGEHQPTGTTTEGAIGAIPQQDLVASPRRDEVQRTCYKCSGVQLWRLKDANEQICAHCYPPAVDLDLVDWLPKPIESEALDVPVDVESTVGDAGSEQCHAH